MKELLDREEIYSPKSKIDWWDVLNWFVIIGGIVVLLNEMFHIIV